MPINAVVFDLEGPISSLTEESLHQVIRSQVEYLKNLEIETAFSRLYREMLDSMKLLEERNPADSPKIHMFAELWKTVLKRFYAVNDEAAIMGAARNYMEEMVKATPPNDDARRIIGKLSGEGRKLVAFTPREEEYLERYLEVYGLEGFFSLKFSGSRTEHVYPNSDPFLLIQQALGLPPVETIVVSNSAKCLQAANNAGMASYWLMRGLKAERAVAEYSENDLLLLEKIVSV